MIFSRAALFSTAILTGLVCAQGIWAQTDETPDGGAEEIHQARRDAGEIAENLTEGQVLGETGIAVDEENVLPKMPFGAVAVDSAIMRADKERIAEWLQSELLLSEQLMVRASCAVILAFPERYNVDFEVAGSDEWITADVLHPFCETVVVMEPGPVDAGESKDAEEAAIQDAGE